MAPVDAKKNCRTGSALAGNSSDKSELLSPVTDFLKDSLFPVAFRMIYC